MKTFNVHLVGGAVVPVRAESYRHEGEQYVFDVSNSSEVQFFRDTEVAGIVEAIASSLKNFRPQAGMPGVEVEFGELRPGI